MTHTVKNACNAGDPSLIPESGRSSGEGNGNPTPVFLPRESHRGYNQRSQWVRHDWATNTHTQCQVHSPCCAMSFTFHPEGTEDKTQLRQTELVRDMKNLNLTSRSVLPKKYGPKACALWRSTCPSIVRVGPGRNSSSFEDNFTFFCPFGLPPHPCWVCPTSTLPQSASGPRWSDEGNVTAGTFHRYSLVFHLAPICLPLLASLHLCISAQAVFSCENTVELSGYMSQSWNQTSLVSSPVSYLLRICLCASPLTPLNLSDLMVNQDKNGTHTTVVVMNIYYEHFSHCLPQNCT